MAGVGPAEGGWRRVADVKSLAAALLGLILMGGAIADPAKAQIATPETVAAMAPTGRLRAAINYGNAVLAVLAPDGRLSGISVDMAEELGRRLAVPVELVPFDAAGKVADAAGANLWDVAFLAVDPKRGEDIAFSPPYVIIEGTYLVPEASPVATVEDADKAGVRIAVGRGSAYDLFLGRALKHATLVRVPTSPAAVALFQSDGLEAAAGVRQPLVEFVRSHPGFRVLAGRFMAIEQAMGIPQGRAPEALAFLKAFVEEAKASGFVAESVARNGQPDAVVAPPASR